jgi:glycosyltransferase involved in cell wall biosynthesis
MARLAGPVAEELGIAAVGHLRDILRLNRAAIRDLNRNRLLLAVSEATRDWHVTQGLDADRVRVLYNGVDLDEFRPRPATGWLHQELGFDFTAPLVAAIGQIGMRKGLDVWLQAASHVAEEHVSARFLIIGERFSQKSEALEYERRIHAMASAEPLRGRCRFLGSRRDVSEILPELALLMHAARQEPLGRVLLESSAAGVPVVATDVGGTAEIFGERAALLVPPDNALRLGAGALRILNNHELSTRLGGEARKRAELCFSRNVAARRLLDAYDATLRAV